MSLHQGKFWRSFLGHDQNNPETIHSQDPKKGDFTGTFGDLFCHIANTNWKL